VYRKFDGLVESHSGDDLQDYLTPHRLRLGEFDCSLLQGSRVSYNLTGVINYSMGLPQLPRQPIKTFDALTPKFELLKVAGINNNFQLEAFNSTL